MWRRVRNKTGPLFQGVIYRWAWLWHFGFSLSLSRSKTYFPQIPGLMEVVQGHNAWSSPHVSLQGMVDPWPAVTLELQGHIFLQ